MDQSIWILEYFSETANKTIWVNEALFIEPLLFKKLQLLEVNNCIVHEVEC